MESYSVDKQVTKEEENTLPIGMFRHILIDNALKGNVNAPTPDLDF